MTARGRACVGWGVVALAAVLAQPTGAAATVAPVASESPRVRFTINERWRYAPGELAGAEAVMFDDVDWTPVDLPHTWNAEDAFTETLEYRRGVGWYRKALNLDRSLRGKRLFLFFEGANQVADVLVNGQAAGRHVGGYTAFAFDVTDLMRFDAANVIAVRVDNRHDDDIPPLNADYIDHIFYGHGPARALRTVRARVILDQPDAAGTWASDHFGVAARFEVSGW